MRIAVKLTMDGLIRALRLKAHAFADTAALARPVRKDARKPRRKASPKDKSHG